VQQCPVCRTEITGLEDERGYCTVSELRERYKQDCFDLRFRRHPYDLPSPDRQPYGTSGEETTSLLSYFTFPEQIRMGTVECQESAEGGYLLRVCIPTVIIELVDSNGGLQGPGHEPVVIAIDHSSVQGSVTPDCAMVNNGVAVFEQLEFVCKCETPHEDPMLLALKFTALAPDQMVHKKSVYAGLYLQHEDKGCTCLMYFFILAGILAVGAGVSAALLTQGIEF